MDGQRIAHYEIESRLGGGGMGEVWKAYGQKLNRDVAVKVRPEGRQTTPSGRPADISNPSVA